MTQKAAQQIGFMIVSEIQNELSGPRHGRWYPVPGNIFYDRLTNKELRAENYHVKFTGARSRNEIQGAAYRASAPYESPAVRTGRLRQSFNFVVSMISENNWEVKVSTNVVYADDLQYGTERISPRPFVEKAMEKVIPKIHEVQMFFAYQITRET